MKGLIISLLLAGNISFGQNFFEEEQMIHSGAFFKETTYGKHTAILTSQKLLNIPTKTVNDFWQMRELSATN